MNCCTCQGACSHLGPHTYCQAHDPKRRQLCPHCGYCPHCGRGGNYLMPKRSSDYHSWLLTQLADPDEAASYLNAAIEDSPQMFLKALRNVAEAYGMSKVAEEAGRARESLYRTLSEEGNPRLDTLTSILEVLGLRIAVVQGRGYHKSGFEADGE